MLAKIVELTEGRSLAANIELVYNNARLGAEIAAEYHQIKNAQEAMKNISFV